MTDQPSPACPVCGAAMSWDTEDERYECAGLVQHCYTVETDGGQRQLMLTASSSGEDAELFSTYPLNLPEGATPAAAAQPAKDTGPACPVCGFAMSWDPEDDRFECAGPVQHCYTVEGAGPARELLLTASSSGEDAELFSTYPWPE